MCYLVAEAVMFLAAAIEAAGAHLTTAVDSRPAHREAFEHEVAAVTSLSSVQPLQLLTLCFIRGVQAGA